MLNIEKRRIVKLTLEHINYPYSFFTCIYWR